MKSVISSQERFSKIKEPKVSRSTFDRSHGYKTTFNAGELIPVYVDEALPGDTFNLSASIFGRLNTPLKPIMDNLYADLHFFSVPLRLVWDNWQRFNGEQDTPTSSTDFLMPTMTSPDGGYTESSIFDYLGLPTKVSGIEHRADFLRAQNLIWNEWYRDENLQDSLPVYKTDGPDNPDDYSILKRGKRKDYFTSALPWAQKADPVTIPLGTSAPVDRIDNAPLVNVYGAGGNTLEPNSTFNISSGYMTNASFSGITLGFNGGLEADLSQATAATVNAWREAFQIQALFELDARGGTRYTELIRVHFGVTSPDARLQRPEYLGGFSTSINVNPIAQNSATVSGQTPQGNLSAIGTFGESKRGFTKSFTEHEILLGFISVRADLNYQQGLNRMWSRSTRFDFYWPSLANLGEQAILNKEIYAQGTDDDDDVFGYQERYSDYKYKPSMVTSTFRSNHDTSLDIWHLAQDFASLPSLNSSFIEENPPMDRIEAVPSEPDFQLDCFFKLTCARPMPTYAVPASFSRI